MAWIAGVIKYHIIKYCQLVHSQARACHMWNGATATENAMLLEFYMG